jgi:hypothetical protein
MAADAGSLSNVKLLFHEDEDLLRAEDHQGRTALHIACMNGCRNIVSFLLENGADPLVRMEGGLNCLEVAVMNKQDDVVKELLLSDHWKDVSGMYSFLLIIYIYNLHHHPHEHHHYHHHYHHPTITTTTIITTTTLPPSSSSSPPSLPPSLPPSSVTPSSPPLLPPHRHYHHHHHHRITIIITTLPSSSPPSLLPSLSALLHSSIVEYPTN